MGIRKVTVKKQVADNIASIAWYIESRGLISTAEKFSDDVYDYFLKLSDTKRSYANCREPGRAALGYKCVTFKKKYTIVFIETGKELIISEFIPSKLIYW